MSASEDKGIETLVAEIVTIVNTLGQQDIDTLSGDTLSRLAVKVASYKASLGVHVADAKKAMWDAEAQYQLARAEGYKKLRAEGKSGTDAAELKHIEAKDALSRLNQARYTSERVSRLSADCHDLIDGIKSRLINLQTERSESNVQ